MKTRTLGTTALVPLAICGLALFASRQVRADEIAAFSSVSVQGALSFDGGHTANAVFIQALTLGSGPNADAVGNVRILASDGPMAMIMGAPVKTMSFLDDSPGYHLVITSYPYYYMDLRSSVPGVAGTLKYIRCITVVDVKTPHAVPGTVYGSACRIGFTVYDLSDPSNATTLTTPCIETPPSDVQLVADHLMGDPFYGYGLWPMWRGVTTIFRL